MWSNRFRSLSSTLSFLLLAFLLPTRGMATGRGARGAAAAKDVAAAESDLDRALGALPGLETPFSQPIRDNVLESISQIDGQVVITVFGEEASMLQAQVDEILRRIRGGPGVGRAFIDRAGDVPQSVIDIERDKLPVPAGREEVGVLAPTAAVSTPR